MHWTRHSEAALVNALAMDVTSIVEEALERGAITRADLMKLLGVSNARISQLLSAPGNLTLRTMVRLAKACGKDIAIVAHDYQGEETGPIHPQVFVETWRRCGQPKMMWEFEGEARPPEPPSSPPPGQE